MFWLAVHLPLLSLEAFCASLSAEQLQRPVVLLSQHQVSAANPLALQRGVQLGHKRATALALAADLLIGQADAQRDAQALLAVAHVALAFTPSVTRHELQHTVLLEVQSTLRYFGGAARLLQRLRAALAPLGHQAQVCSAPTALGAALLALCAPHGALAAAPNPSASRVRPKLSHPANRRQQGLREPSHPHTLADLQQRLNPLPLALALQGLAPAHEHAQTLQGMGLHTLHDLRRLPRAGLARRVGEALLSRIDQAYGDKPEAHSWLSLPTHFHSQLELHSRADTTAQVLHGAQMLLARLVAWAQARQARVAAFTLVMHHEQRHRDEQTPVTQLRIALAEPGNDPQHLQLLLRERLAHVQLAAPTLDLELRCHELLARAEPNGELFPSRQGEAEGLTRLLERLRARLGDEQVQWLHAHADHRPEHATRLSSTPPRRSPTPRFRDSSSGISDSTHSSDPLPMPRPLWLLSEPQPLAERDSLPLLEGQALHLLAGPERIESGWWDGALVVRDYFIAQCSDGSLVWVYRHRLPPADNGHPATATRASRADGAHGSISAWMLQGRFG